MTKIDIFSGFLGAGKTTLIKKLIKEAYQGEKVVLIENEFGEIGIDGGFLQEAGINITEMNSGCICCSLVGDFAAALQKVAAEYAPDRIVIEPSGVGKLSDVIKAVANADLENATLNSFCTVVDAKKCKVYLKNFGEFFGDQVENASCIIFSHTSGVSQEKLTSALALLKERNQTATYITADWEQLDGKQILAAMEQKNSLQAELARLFDEVHHHHEHHHGHEHCCGHDHEHHHDEECDDPDCCCHHGHHHEHHHEHEHCCGHDHEHHHDEECDDPDCCCHHGHHHEHDHGHCCGHDHDHEHHHHGHHHAGEVFTSWGIETARNYTQAEVQEMLQKLDDEETYGKVLRAKGIIAGENAWVHFDYVPGESDVREGGAAVTGRLCVIGCGLNEDALKKLFQV